MKRILKILSFVLFTAPVMFGYSQSKYCPQKMLLIDIYKKKNYTEAKQYIDTVLINCKDQNEDAYFWHLCGNIYFKVFTNVDSRSPIAKSRNQSVEAFTRSKSLDNDDDFLDHNKKALKILASTYYNDAAMILQNMDTLHINDVSLFFNKYKTISKLLDPDANFQNKDVEITHGLGMLYKIKYENDKKAYRHFMDSSINCFNRSIAINPNHYSSNYNLGIIYHNLGVDIILDDLEIDADLEKVIVMQEKAIGYFSDALPYLKKVYEMKPTDKAIVQGIAAVYYSLNDMEKHVEFMNVLKDLDNPSSPNNNK